MLLHKEKPKNIKSDQLKIGDLSHWLENDKYYECVEKLDYYGEYYKIYYKNMHIDEYRYFNGGKWASISGGRMNFPILNDFRNAFLYIEKMYKVLVTKSITT